MAAKGGDWDFMTQGAFRVKAVDEALFRLSAGQVAPLVEADDAWYVVKALAREEGRTVPFTEVQGEIEQEIRDERFNDAAAKYIQDLYSRAYVRIVKENQ
jgi:parvulin-like peptidyl-prolyl isomerase